MRLRFFHFDACRYRMSAHFDAEDAAAIADSVSLARFAIISSMRD